MGQASKKRKVQARETCLAIEHNFGFQESCAMSARTSKRASPFWATHFESCNEKVDKMRAIEKQSEGRRVISGYPSSFLTKVDAVAYPRECLGEIYMHASSNNQAVGSCEMERRTPNNFVNSLCGRSSESNDSDSDACSVGSCSVNSDSPNRLFNCVVAGKSPDADTLVVMLNLLWPWRQGRKLFPPLRRGCYKLHAYRCTLGVFYASGPLSWEQEALLTNLRISLNISNDEHLMELRNLGHSWRHVNFASKGLKMMLGTCGSPSFFWLNELGAMCAGIMCRVLDELKAEL
ncbi:hypothetical protein NC652_039220 [Populus alba x Populus x berolinensis]|nr:hypothetical protein NC652_039220 [Populus alba x Populus x berolinensis]